MSRVIATEHPGQVISVTIQKSIAGVEPAGFLHACTIQPGDDPAAVLAVVNHDLTTRLKCEPIDGSWAAVVVPLVATLHTPSVVAAFATAYTAANKQTFMPLAAAMADKMIAGS